MAASKTFTIPAHVQEILRTGVEIDGCNVRIVDKLDPKVYLDCSKILQALGGKWKGGKIQATVFNVDAAPLLEAALDQGKVANRRTVLQAFFSKPALALRMLQMLDLTENDTFLEPSAGEGALIQPILSGAVKKPKVVIMTEIDEQHHAKLLDVVESFKLGFPDYAVAALLDDFLMQELCYRPTAIAMNPPFTEGRALAHIQRAYEVLAPGGRMVAIASESDFNTGKVLLQTWLRPLNPLIEPLPADSFENTSARARLIYLTKPAAT
jgi:phospholipid N-methyltransferase